jgi:hypothetical protein
MGKKGKTQHISANILGQQLALSVAAGLARTQLVPDPLKTYDAQHLSDMLNVIGRALAKVAPLYVKEDATLTPRELSQDQLEGAEIRRGATVLVLKDGRTLSSVSIRRGDLRQAIAILKTVGIQELVPRPEPAQAPKASAPERVDPFALFAEIEKLLRPPLVAGQVDRANSLAVSLARNAPHGRVANRAMQLISAAYQAREEPAPQFDRVKLALAELRVALQEHPRQEIA